VTYYRLAAGICFCFKLLDAFPLVHAMCSSSPLKHPTLPALSLTKTGTSETTVVGSDILQKNRSGRNKHEQLQNVSSRALAVVVTGEEIGADKTG
jgi:hypothetical protein